MIVVKEISKLLLPRVCRGWHGKKVFPETQAGADSRANCYV